MPFAQDTAAVDIPIADKVNFLRDTSNYSGGEDRIDVVETHFSWVFLTTSYAYKLKKPARGEGFDFRSADARLRNARAELRLNHRLAPRVYLGIVSLTRQPDGSLQLSGTGAAIDWLVKMRRLEADWMLDRRLLDRRWKHAELESLAQCLAQFFATGRPAKLNETAYFRLIQRDLDRTLGAMSIVAEPRLQTATSMLVRGLRAFVCRRGRMFRRRLAERRLIDGHGDLRPEHVYLRDTPQVIDCLEFRADLRRLDPVSEIAFLTLECNRLGATPIGHLLLRRYRQRSHDALPCELVAFYTAFNALIRARLAVEHIAEPGARTREQWIERAAGYLAIAASANRRLSRSHKPVPARADWPEVYRR